MSTLELYWPLASSKTSERLKASTDLLKLLLQFQQDFTPIEDENDDEDADNSQDEDEKEDKSEVKAIETWIERRHAPDVSYAIKRLIRGLSSPREYSRVGFAVTLTKVSTFQSICSSNHL